MIIFVLYRSQPVVSDSPGRSGAKFYNSSDGLFVIKTLTREEVEQMHLLLKEYHPVSTKMTINHHMFLSKLFHFNCASILLSDMAKRCCHSILACTA